MYIKVSCVVILYSQLNRDSHKMTPKNKTKENENGKTKKTEKTKINKKQKLSVVSCQCFLALNFTFGKNENKFCYVQMCINWIRTLFSFYFSFSFYCCTNVHNTKEKISCFLCFCEKAFIDLSHQHPHFFETNEQQKAREAPGRFKFEYERTDGSWRNGYIIIITSTSSISFRCMCHLSGECIIVGC